MSGTPFSIRLSPETRLQLDREAKSVDRSASYVATKAIEQFLAARIESRRVLEAAIAEADKGVFISEGAMDRWLDSWGGDNELPAPEPDVFPAGKRG